jgi:hypothetical protein
MVWVEDDDANFYPAALCRYESASTTPRALSSSATVSAKDIFYNVATPGGSKENAKVLLNGSASSVPFSKIHMWYKAETGSPEEKEKSCQVDVLAAPTNLPSVLELLRVRCEHGATLARAGPAVFLALRPEGEAGGGTGLPADDERLRPAVLQAADIALKTIETGNCASLVISGCSGSGE